MLRVRLPFVPLLLVLLALAPSARGDDVPDAARKDYDAACQAMAQGDAKKAFSAISKGKDKAGLSVDFWEAFVRIWRANGKPENTLWDTIIGKRAAEAPGSPAFDLVRARLETDPSRREEHLRAAIAKDPKAVEPRLLLLRALVAAAKDDEAEELLDALLEEQPDLEDALVIKAEMQIASGLARSAANFAEERLAKAESAPLRHLLAQAYLKLSANDPALLDKAVESAKTAVELRPDDEFVATLADLLDRKGDLAGATAALEGALAKRASPLLSGLLGGFAFRAGNYAAAVKGLAASASNDIGAAKALAMAYGRLGLQSEAKKAVTQVLALDPEQAEFAAAVTARLLGDAAGARRQLQGRTSDAALDLLAWIDAEEGNFAAATARYGERAKDGSRWGEEALLPILTARAIQKLGPKAADLRKSLLAARWKAGGAMTPGPVRPEYEAPSEAKSAGMMARLVTYRRTICGGWFERGEFLPVAITSVNGRPAMGSGARASSACPGDEARDFVFNAQVLEGENITITVNPNNEIWAAAEPAFQAGCAAAVAGDAAAAVTGFTKALEQEPTWGRARLFRAAVQATLGTPDASVAAEAKEAMKLLPDDHEGLRLSLLVRAIAGDPPGPEVETWGRIVETFCVRKMGDL